ncbi:molecular chaperone [Terrihabitans rhizophilus]|uniref:Molecular chaperone n=1 Tax=Terrihabitans rhizophilus TaxID=3092662 RepID=A0ABU4RRD4_9HYPH|nr:molecular chaperone [Terrihabitans sp. PJ23]MDX6807410.1 molecular chaperone [Terrihabitans sp. PJ23]
MSRQCLFAFLFLVSPTLAQAAALHVSPVLIEKTAPAAAAALTVRNAGAEPMTVQTRVFRWVQVGGEDKLEPTADIAVSPPMMKLQPGVDNVVRIVRTSKQPIVSEQSYRVVVDELPVAGRARSGTVNFLVRHSIPVFFRPPTETPPAADWLATRSGRQITLTLNNRGQRRLRVADLLVKDASGAKVAQNSGLVGYALAGSTVRWTLPASGGAGPYNIEATSESGAIRAKAGQAPR